MKLDFFDKKCQEPPLNQEKFGICDDQEGGRAYTSLKNESIWVATVENKNKIELTFTAIDKCVLKDDEYEGRGRCDGMLTSKKHLYLIELKNQREEWIKHAKEQLESTINFLMENHLEELNSYKHKKVIACNKKRQRFTVIDQGEQNAFFRKYKFRIDIQAKVVVV